MTTLEKIQIEIDNFNKKKQDLINELKPEFSNLFKNVFETYPIDAFKFTQYTPYFNDGDECIFNVNECYNVKLNGEEEFTDKYDDKIYNKDSWKQCFKEINSILQSIPEDFMKEMFDNHVEITINKNGYIKVEEYEHD